MTRSQLSALLAIWVATLAAVSGCGRTELNLCANGVPCHDASASTCPGGNCDGGQPDGKQPDGKQPDAPICGAGFEACGAACVDIRSDSANCGGCGNRCGANQACRNGSCGCSAPRQTS